METNDIIKDFLSKLDDSVSVSDLKEQFGLSEDTKNILGGKYDEITTITRCGIIAVKKKGRFGFLNLNFEPITKCVYSSYCIYNKFNLIRVGKGEKVGLINKQGVQVLPIEYDSIDNNTQGDEHIFNIKKGDKVGIIDTSGKLLLPIMYDNITTYFSGDIMIIKLGDKHALCNSKYEFLTEFIYDDIYKVGNNFRYTIKDTNECNVINRQGVKLLPDIEDVKTISYINNSFGSGFYKVTTKFDSYLTQGEYIKYSEKGEILNNDLYGIIHWLTILKNDNKLFFENDKKIKLYDTISGFEYGFRVTTSRTEKILDINRNEVKLLSIVPEKYDKVKLIDLNCESYIIFLLNDTFIGIMNCKLFFNVKRRVDFTHIKHNDIYVIRINNCFLVDNMCVEISDYYDSINFLTDDKFIVSKDNKTGLINTKGELITEIKYGIINKFSDGLSLCSVSSPKSDNGGMVFFNRGGFDREHFNIRNFLNINYMFIDTDGNEVLTFKDGERVSDFNSGLAILTNKNNTYIINKEGQKIFKLLKK